MSLKQSTHAGPTRRDFLRSSALALSSVAAGCHSWRRSAKPARRPNIVLIMADDMGYSDIGCYGGEIRTPNLNQLARNGVRFTQFYNTGRCCPTRASLLSGLYPHQAGMGHMVGGTSTKGYSGDLNNRCVTIAEVLGQAGYGTYMSGKWHVTRYKKAKTEAEKYDWPVQRGFDRFYGIITGAGNYFGPQNLTRDNTPIDAPKENYYFTDAISDQASTFIKDHVRSKPDNPFFSYVAYTAPHWPLHAPKEAVERYLGKYMKGWDALRAERHARMIALGVVDAEWPLTPRDEPAKAWEDVAPEKKKEMDKRMAVYAAMIDVMDQGIGRIVDTLRETGQLDNTLIFFLADNGGCAEGGPWGFGNINIGAAGEYAGFSSYGLSWANASNTPFRRYKHWVHEGGVATPLVVHWPAGIDARDEIRHEPGHLIDIMATCVAVAGADYPAVHNGVSIVPMEGKSLVPALEGKPLEREALYWEHEGNCAVRAGRRKLVCQNTGNFWHPGPWELYDMESDRTELNDLAAKHPERAKRLAAMWEAWARRAGALPWPEKKKEMQEKAKSEKNGGSTK